ncbi:glycosyltransferase family 4 protein [Ancylomarina longa]|uniref:Glycosyltransferase family 1 protein n=1 Tax=Ancylomarina longa TaxID=2487017 RepID=A0A434AZ30_9BACT|nr:glycosyltransferase family 4 protein [Ancylomarina longa]RUT79879.1 glycosyltransferase family 1 protein [Ancylomarina longa]
MKVLIISSLPQNLDFVKSGVDAVIINLMKGFELFPEISFLILSLGKSDHESTVKYAHNIKIQYLRKKRPVGGILFYYLFDARKAIQKIILEFKADIVHVQGASPILFCLRGLCKRNLVITQHGIMAEEINYQNTKFDKLKFGFKKLVERYYFPKFRNYTFISNYNRRFLEELKGNDQYKGKLIYNPVNPVFFDLKIHRTFGKRIVYVGVINPRKNLLCLLKEMQRIKGQINGLKLDVIGGFKDEAYKNKILQFITDNNLQDDIRILGWKSQSEVLELYGEADLFVLPSLQESLPVSIAEAMAAGRPVIATDVGGVTEMITHEESGFVFRTNNSIELGNYLLRFCKGDVSYSDFATNAREEALKKFHPRNVAAQTIEFYKEILKN